jgi:DNA-binding MarR family transcriptional regulator
LRPPLFKQTFNPLSTALSRSRATPVVVPQRPADNLLALVHVFSALIGRAFYAPLESRHGVTVAEWRIMLSLYQQPGATAAEIIESWAMEKMAASRAIRQLERRGWVMRRQRASDKRSYALNLTVQGRKSCQAVLPAANGRYRDIVACLSRPERQQFERALARLIAHTRALGH